uniref:Uncharacterized protein n=1 Tax=Rhizophora mucronata TaxID=61149 RepID=A0A2P2P3F3_RHIMU
MASNEQTDFLRHCSSMLNCQMQVKVVCMGKGEQLNYQQYRRKKIANINNACISKCQEKIDFMNKKPPM